MFHVTASEMLVDISIVLGLGTIIRAIRNATRAWDGMKASVIKLNDTIAELVVKKEQDHVLMNKRIDALEVLNAVRNGERRRQVPGKEQRHGEGRGNP